MPRGQRAQPGRKKGNAKTVRGADPHGAGHVFTLAGNLGARGDHVGFHAFRRCQQLLARRRQFRACRQAVKELCANRFLQRRHPP